MALFGESGEKHTNPIHTLLSNKIKWIAMAEHCRLDTSGAYLVFDVSPLSMEDITKKLFIAQ